MNLSWIYRLKMRFMKLDQYYKDLYPELKITRKDVEVEQFESGKQIYKNHVEYPDRDADDIEGIVVHHSAGGSGPRDIEEMHIYERGYPGAMYHYIIHEGMIYRMNPITKNVFHAGNWEINKTHIGVCFVGNYMNEDVKDVDKAAFDVLYGALALSCGQLDIKGHRDVKATLCPGDKLYSFVKYVKARYS